MMNTPKRWPWMIVGAISLILYLGNSQGRAFDANSGNTGAPGETATCQTCHSSSALQVTLTIAFTDTLGNEVSVYQPDSIYRLTVQMEHKIGVPIAYGFQMVSLDDATQNDAGSWFQPADNVRLASSSRTMHHYAEHKGPSASNVFTTDWIAPPAGTGNVTFYAAGVGANLSGSDQGDGASFDQITIEEATTTSVSAASKTALTWYPNPVQSTLYLRNHKPTDYYLFHVNGQLIRQGTVTDHIDMLGLPAGIYLLQLKASGSIPAWYHILKQ